MIEPFILAIDTTKLVTIELTQSSGKDTGL